MEILERGLNPDDFRLKEIKFFYNTQQCADRLGKEKNYTGVIISNNMTQSPLQVPPYINAMQDLEESVDTFQLDFLYKQTENGKL